MMFDFLLKRKTEEVVNCAYLATKMLEYRGNIDIGEDEKIEKLAEKMISEITETEANSLEDFSDTDIDRYSRIIGKWMESVIFTRELSLEDLKKSDDFFESAASYEDQPEGRYYAVAENPYASEITSRQHLRFSILGLTDPTQMSAEGVESFKTGKVYAAPFVSRYEMWQPGKTQLGARSIKSWGRKDKNDEINALRAVINQAESRLEELKKK